MHDIKVKAPVRFAVHWRDIIRIGKPAPLPCRTPAGSACECARGKSIVHCQNSEPNVPRRRPSVAFGNFVVILSGVPRVWAVRTNAGWCLTWLLVVLVSMASLDRVPDPPAVRPDYTQIKISAPHAQLATPAVRCSLLVAMLQPPVERRASLTAVPVGHRGLTLVLRRAADSSPPIL